MKYFILKKKKKKKSCFIFGFKFDLYWCKVFLYLKSSGLTENGEV